MNLCRLQIDSIDISKILSSETFSSIPIKKFNKGNMLYDDSKLKLYIFKSGKAKVVLYQNDEEFILYYLNKNNIIIPEESFPIEFLEDSEIYVLDAKIFAHLFKIEEFSVAIIESLKRRAEIERRIIKNMLFKTCKNRVSTFIYEIAASQNTKLENGSIVKLDLSIKDLATFIGSKRQTVSTIFNELLSLGILEKVSKSTYSIVDLEKLNNYKSNYC